MNSRFKSIGFSLPTHIVLLGEDLECDEDLSYRIKCREYDIPYLGFFHGIYSCEDPFEYEKRTI
ncbi:hypothetical protein D3C77_286440 [compost metagenome]